VKKNSNQLNQLAALQALGALDGDEAHVFAARLAQDTDAQNTVHAFGAVTEALAQSLPGVRPSAGLKDRLLAAAEKAKKRSRMGEAMAQMLPKPQNGLAFMEKAGESGWVPLPVAGAYVKLLSFDTASEYAVVLGKLDPGSRYPGHTHRHPEDIFMLSGDLHVGEEVLRAGDFHHAEAGSEHQVNWSERGCTLICVLSKEDLMNQIG
jgi:anti-sigma factor ChrR (cupin superfamily)